MAHRFRDITKGSPVGPVASYNGILNFRWRAPRGHAVAHPPAPALASLNCTNGSYAPKKASFFGEVDEDLVACLSAKSHERFRNRSPVDDLAADMCVLVMRTCEHWF
ncbi:hypothetical protein ACJJTC_004957 [Scirpophaga incertulas]